MSARGARAPALVQLISKVGRVWICASAMCPASGAAVCHARCTGKAGAWQAASTMRQMCVLVLTSTYNLFR